MSDIKSGVVLVTKFVSPGTHKFQSYIDYINRAEAVRNEAYTDYSISDLQSELNKYGDYTDYMGNPEKTSELFTEDKDNLSLGEKDVLKQSFEMAQDNESLMWQTVISFDNRWLAEQGLFDLETHTVNEAKLKECARGAMSRIIKNENISNSAVWSGAIHYNTNHIHIHLAMVEITPTREIIQDGEYAGQRKGKFKKATLEQAKSFIVNNILTDKENNQGINDLIRKSLVAAMQENDILEDKELRDLYLKIYSRLPANKRLWQYNRNIINSVRPDLDKLITKWIEKYHKDDFDKLKKELQTQQAVFQTAYGTRKDETKSNYAENKIKELYSRLGNVVLSTLKTLEITEDMEIPNIEPSEENEIAELPDEVVNQYEEYTIIEHAALIFDSAPDEITATRSSDYHEAKKLMYQKPPDFTTAFELLSVEAAKGSLYAIYDLAYLYSKGLGCEKNFDRANELYSLALHGFYEELKKTENNLKLDTKKQQFKNSYFNYRIAKMHYYGLGTEVDKEKAYHYFTASDSLFARYYIARYYAQGEVVEKDLEKAFNLYKEIADTTLQPNTKQSMPYAVYKVAQMLESGTGTAADMKKAQEYYKSALSLFLVSNEARPDDQLQYRIGKMYYEGKGAKVDIEKAKEFYISASELGNDMANYALAMLYLNDKSTPSELIEKALAMLELSADSEKRNNPLAQYQLGKIYLEQGNQEKGIYYLTLSANQNNQYAQYRLGTFFLETNPDKGLSYLFKSAEQNNQFAQYKLGVYYTEKSDKSEEDLYTGLKFLKDAADNKNCFAGYRLGKIYFSGENVMQDCEQAEHYLLQALNNRDETLNNFTQIEHLLGKLYFNGGSKFEIDIEKGLKYYTVAAERGNQFSQYALGSIYYYGINGVPQNLEMARHYLSLSVEQGNERAILLMNKVNNPYHPQQSHRKFPPAYHNLNINLNLGNLFRALGREYKSYENYINQQIYAEMQREIESET